MLEKSLKMLEFGIKTSRPLKVLENRWGAWKYLKVLEFKSRKFWNFAFADNLEPSTCMHDNSLSHCSLNFECPHLGYGFLSIILVLEKCNLGPWKVLELCTLSLLVCSVGILCAGCECGAWELPCRDAAAARHLISRLQHLDGVQPLQHLQARPWRRTRRWAELRFTLGFPRVLHRPEQPLK